MIFIVGYDLEKGIETPEEVISNIKLNDEFLNRELAQQLDNQIVPDEDRLDAWIGPGGDLTQSSDPTGQTYYEGVGSLEEYVDPDTGGAADQTTSDLFGMYTDKFGRNPDEEGLEYWEDEVKTRVDAGEKYEDVIDNVGESFDAGAETELREALSSGQDLSATQDLTNLNNNVFTENAPDLTPDSPFYVDPNFNFEEEVAKLALDPSNPFAEQNAQLQAEQEDEIQTPAPVKTVTDLYNSYNDPNTELTPASEIDWSDPNWVYGTYDWSK